MRADRLNLMEEYIMRQGTVSLEDLAAQFEISINTVRRDLKTLLQRNTVSKVYGGVAANAQPMRQFERSACKVGDEKDQKGLDHQRYRNQHNVQRII